MVVGADSDLAPQLQADLDELLAGVADNISALLLVDLPGNDGTAVVELTKDGIRPLHQGPEICTGDPTALADFFSRALLSYSTTTRFALGFWGHGQGVFGDNDAGERLLPTALHPLPFQRLALDTHHQQAMLPDQTSGGILTNREARSALIAAFLRARRTEPVDLIFSDTCLNGSIEVFSELAPFSQVVLASSMTVPGEGWNYKFWLQQTTKEPPADAQEWARQAVQAFEWAHPQLGDFPQAQLAAYATDIDLAAAFAPIVQALQQIPQRRTLLGLAARQVTSIQHRENLDLEHLVYQLSKLAEDDSALKHACRAFLRSMNQALVAISAAPEGAELLSGLTIWCPVRGDLDQVGAYYRHLTFPRLTGWGELLVQELP